MLEGDRSQLLPAQEGRGEEICSLPGLCLHPGVTVVPASISASHAYWLELAHGDFKADGGACEPLR